MRIMVRDLVSGRACRMTRRELRDLLRTRERDALLMRGTQPDAMIVYALVRDDGRVPSVDLIRSTAYSRQSFERCFGKEGVKAIWV